MNLKYHGDLGQVCAVLVGQEFLPFAMSHWLVALTASGPNWQEKMMSFSEILFLSELTCPVRIGLWVHVEVADLLSIFWCTRESGRAGNIRHPAAYAKSPYQEVGSKPVILL